MRLFIAIAERLRKIDQHQGFVKGVCWDPVGEFLATGSDDRSVRIWRTTDWELEAEVKKPFDHSPGTFFRRLRYVRHIQPNSYPHGPQLVTGWRAHHCLERDEQRGLCLHCSCDRAEFMDVGDQLGGTREYRRSRCTSGCSITTRTY